MKKIFLLLSAACVVASAAATDLSGQKILSAEKMAKSKFSKASVAPRSKSASKLSQKLGSLKSASTRAADEFMFYRPSASVWAAGCTTNGYSWQGSTFGFASSYGEVVFNNFSNGVDEFEWEYGFYNQELQDYDYVTNSDRNLKVKPGINEMSIPVLSAKGNPKLVYFPDYVKAYVFGGSGNSWFGQDELGGDMGVTSYQNFGMQNPEGYSAAVTYMSSYDVSNSRDYNENGVCKDWIEVFEDMSDGGKIEDVVMENFSMLVTKPNSPYIMSRTWLGLNVTATDDTQLISYIYTVDEEGMLSEDPIAVGYAVVTTDADQLTLFDYYLLNEDGDELEEPIVIDSEIMVTIEGFSGNSNIKSLMPTSGFYPFSLEQYQAGNRYIMAPTLYMTFSLKVNGEPVTTLQFDDGAYYYNQKQKPNGEYVDPNTLSFYAYHQMCMDAVFPYIYTEDGESNVTVNLPKEGGKESEIVDSYFYDVKSMLEDGYYTLSSPEWVDVTVSDFDEKTGLTTLTVSAEASEQGREGDVVLEGFGIALTLHVVQGEGNAVSSISIEQGAEYFDLQGRRVANPEKGLYIKKTGNTTTKVIL